MFNSKINQGNILQINVRLSEGGAAGVALTLHHHLKSVGFESNFAYGYSSRGKDSPNQEIEGAFRITPTLTAATNLMLFPILGEEVKTNVFDRKYALRKAIEKADIIHLHVVHSYMVNLSELLDLIIKAKKPVVWTLHDEWLLTGRCALPGSCTKYTSGCGGCKTMSSYPPGIVDHSARVWESKRKELFRLQNSVPLALVACANWLAETAQLAGLENIKVIQNSVDEIFWNSIGERPIPPQGGKLQVLFVCRDLRDTNKVDWGLLSRISQIPSVCLTVVGDNPPQRLGNANWLPAIKSRSELAAIMSSHNILVFFSQVDYFPLTIAEALSAGMRVVALESRAAQELQRMGTIALCSTPEELVNEIRQIGLGNRPTLKVLRNEFFRPERMVKDYLRIYDSVS